MSQDTVNIHVGGTFDDVAKRVADIWHRARLGQDVTTEHHVTFESLEAMTAVISPKRLALLRHLRQHPVDNVRALARDLGRDYKRVHEDVALLESAGLIGRIGRSLHAACDKFSVEVSL